MESLTQKLQEVQEKTNGLNDLVQKTLQESQRIAQTQFDQLPSDEVTMAFTVFMLACFVGYYVVWRVTPALHSPLMAVTNAVSSVIIVGALLAAGTATGLSSTFGLFGIFIASINIFGGFVVTARMLSMFSKKK